MVSLDAKIHLRCALNDNPKLHPRTKDIIEGNTCHVPLLALAAFGLVLGSFYQAKPSEIVRTTRTLLQLRTLRFEYESCVSQALAGVEARIDWFDALLRAGTPAQNESASLDKRLAIQATELGWQAPVQLML